MFTSNYFNILNEKEDCYNVFEGRKSFRAPAKTQTEVMKRRDIIDQPAESKDDIIRGRKRSGDVFGLYG